MGRFAFYALLPALALPFLIVAGSFAHTLASPTSSYNVDYIVIAVFCFMLIGSNAVNTWLIARHPLNWQQRALPRGQALALTILWALEAVGVVLASLMRLDGWQLALAFVLIVMSIVVFGYAVARRRQGVEVAPETSVRLSPYAAVLGWVYLATVAVAIGLSILAGPTTGLIMATGITVPLGLPWSWPLTLIAFASNFVLAGSWVVGYVAFALAALSVVANVVIVVLIMFRPAFRVRFVNWFFKLRASSSSA